MAVEYIEYEVPAEGTRVGMIVVRPAVLEEGKKYPLIIFHPGIGERGSGSDLDLDKMKNVPVSLETGAKNYGFFLIEVQPASNYEGGETDEAYQWAKDNFPDNIDFTKAYITGLSLGGGGCQRYLSLNANAHEKFAAAAIMCPGPNQYFVLDKNYPTLANTKVPMWFFHCIDDTVVTPTQSTLLTESKINQLGGSAQYRITLYIKGGHSWVTYSRNVPGARAALPIEATRFNNPNVNIYEWFLLNEVGKAAVMPPVVGEAPIPTPDPIPEPIPPTPTNITIVGVNTAGDNRFNMQTGASTIIEINWSDKTRDTIKAPSDKSDRIKGVWTNLDKGNIKVTADWDKAENQVFGPFKK